MPRDDRPAPLKTGILRSVPPLGLASDLVVPFESMARNERTQRGSSHRPKASWAATRSGTPILHPLGFDLQPGRVLASSAPTARARPGSCAFFTATTGP
jgi:hypothetical protein